MSCTCAGTAPGYPQHEDYCGKPEPVTRERLDLLDVLAQGDGQYWPDLYENQNQQQTAETMYGAQADALLASSWFAERSAVARDLAGLRETIAAAVRPGVGDRVEATLRGTLIDYDSELGVWTLKSDGSEHVAWEIDLHWAQPFRVIERATAPFGSVTG